MFCLKERKLIRGCQAHISAGLGCAADYVASTGTPLYAPSAGKVDRQYTGVEGGKWLYFTDKDGNSLQFAHLSAYVGGLRNVTEGELIAYTGNTGSITTGPHLHVQILKNGVRLDPEKYEWNTVDMSCSPEELALEGFKVAFKAVRATAPEQSYINEWKNSGLVASQFVRGKYYLPTIKELEDKITQYGAEIEQLRADLASCQASHGPTKDEVKTAVNESIDSVFN